MTGIDRADMVIGTSRRKTLYFVNNVGYKLNGNTISNDSAAFASDVIAALEAEFALEAELALA